MMPPVVRRTLCLTALVVGSVPPVHADHDPSHIGTWQSCYLPSSLNACASVTLTRDAFGSHPNSFIAILDSPGAFPVGSGDFRVNAWGFYVPHATDFSITLTQPEDAWGGPPPGWGPGFVFATSTEVWDEALGGPGFGSEGFWGFWEGSSFPTDLRFAWRRVSLDQSEIIDCIQSAPGVTHCVSVAPEPGTWVMLMTGMLGLLVIRRIRKRVDA